MVELRRGCRPRAWKTEATVGGSRSRFVLALVMATLLVWDINLFVCFGFVICTVAMALFVTLPAPTKHVSVRF